MARQHPRERTTKAHGRIADRVHGQGHEAEAGFALPEPAREASARRPLFCQVPASPSLGKPLQRKAAERLNVVVSGR